MFRKIRILILLTLLALIAASGYLAKLRATDWDSPLRVVVYPVNGDDGEVAAEFIDALSSDSFAPIENYLAEQAESYGLDLAEPLEIDLAPAVTTLPPLPPEAGNALEIGLWSLQLRYWAWRNDPYLGPSPQVKLYVLYFDPETSPSLPHSLGLQEGMIGVINAFADRRQEGSNQVVITHELLHTLGATDKYVPGSGQPVFPIGYAEPDSSPRFPQRQAELMGGRIPLSEIESAIPSSLRHTVIGPTTAVEINWIAGE